MNRPDIEPATLSFPMRELAPIIRETLSHGGSMQFRATGGSMRPFLRHGDVVELLPPSPEYRVGDILLFRAEDNFYALHRLRRIRRGKLCLLGDAAIYGEEDIDPSDVLARVSRIRCNGGWRILDEGLWRQLGLLWLTFYPLRRLLRRGFSFVARVRRKVFSILSIPRGGCR